MGCVLGTIATAWTILLPIVTLALPTLTMLDTPDELALQD